MTQKCRYPCSLVSGTVFEARKLPLPTGFLAMHWLHIPRRTSRRCWRLQLKRHLGVSYATPWLLNCKIQDHFRRIGALPDQRPGQQGRG